MPLERRAEENDAFFLDTAGASLGPDTIEVELTRSAGSLAARLSKAGGSGGGKGNISKGFFGAPEGATEEKEALAFDLLMFVGVFLTLGENFLILTVESVSFRTRKRAIARDH